MERMGGDKNDMYDKGYSGVSAVFFKPGFQGNLPTFKDDAVEEEQPANLQLFEESKKQIIMEDLERKLRLLDPNDTTTLLWIGS